MMCHLDQMEELYLYQLSKKLRRYHKDYFISSNKQYQNCVSFKILMRKFFQDI